MQLPQPGSLAQRQHSRGSVNAHAPVFLHGNRCHGPRIPLQQPLLGYLQSSRVGQQQLRSGHVTASSSKSSGDASGDLDPQVLRPKARVSAPPTPPETSTSSSTNGTGPASSGHSYSDFYKSQNTKYYQHASGNSSTSSSSSSSSHHTLGTSSSKTKQPKEDEPDSATATSSSGTEVSSAAASGPSPAESPGAVEEAMQKAEAALAMAESTLSSIEGMDIGLEPPSKWTKIFLLVRKVVAASALCGLMVASHAFGLAWQWAAATLGALGIAGM